MKSTQQMAALALTATLGLELLVLSGCSPSNQDTQTSQTTNAPEQKTDKAVQYTCSMHPEVVQAKPGDCPKCGMKLVVKK